MNLALVHKEYLHQDDFDAVLGIIKSDILENGEECQQDMNLTVEMILVLNNSLPYLCSFCAKVCLLTLYVPAPENG